MPDHNHLSLFVPGLFGPRPDEENQSLLDAVALETYLARADRLLPGISYGFEPAIFSLFEIDPATEEADLPIAAVTRVLDMGVIDKSWWLRADPVHLQPERDRLILTDSSQLEITQDEANRLTADIMEAYAEDGWLLKPARPGRWYLKPPRAAKIITTALPEIVGKDIHPYLPRGKDGKSWHTILNEIQILLHSALVNVEREQTGRLPINSLWFWGGGRLPNIHSVRWAEIWSQEPISLALARLTETPSYGVPDEFKQWLQQTTRTGEHLIVMDHFRTVVQYGDTRGWEEFVHQLERDWIAPLLKAVRDYILASVTLYTDTGQAFRLDSRSVRRWWRRRVNLEGYR